MALAMKRSLKPLTSLRFVAAAMIVIHHSRAFFGYGNWLGNNASLDAGVDFFYVLSGFILYYSYRQFDTPRDVYNFYVARVARIWPLHFATFLMVVMFLPAPWGPPGNIAQEAAANLFLLQAWSSKINYFFSFNDVSWSLSVEAFFYLTFPVLVYRWGDTWKWKLLFCVALVVGLLQYLSVYPDKLVWNGYAIDSTAFIFPPSRLLEFVIGIAACSIWLRCSAAISRLSVWTATILELAALAGACSALHWMKLVSHSFLRHPETFKWISECGYAPAMAVLIFVMASGRGGVSRLLSLKFAVLLGEMSFSVYMCHQIFLRVFAENRSIAVFGGDLAQYIAFWITVLVASYLLWEFIEKPCRQRAVRFFAVNPKVVVVSTLQASSAAD
jgi:peptidoglycan/LPS O-acetylase OafA/YrhL